MIKPICSVCGNLLELKVKRTVIKRKRYDGDYKDIMLEVVMKCKECKQTLIYEEQL